MNQDIKKRPLRIYRDNKGLYVFGSGYKKMRLRKPLLTKQQAQKYLLKELNTTFVPKSKIKKDERPKFIITSSKGIKKASYKAVQNVINTDPGLDNKTKIKKKVDDIADKLVSGDKLTDEEQTLASVYLETQQKEKEAAEKKAEEEKKAAAETDAERKDKIVKALNDEKFDEADLKNIDDFIQGPISNKAIIEYIKFINEKDTAEDLYDIYKISKFSVDRFGNPITYSLKTEKTPRNVNGVDFTKSPYEIKQQLLNRIDWSKLQTYIRNNKDIPEIANAFSSDVLKVFSSVGKQKGKGKFPALYNDEIEDYFDDEQKYPHFGGVIASDQIMQLPKKLPIGFIMNTDDSNGQGEHWVAIYINGDSIEYFDPLADPPSKKFLTDIKKYVESLKVPTMMKLKVNKVKWQHDKTESCGWFCIQFLDNRFHGIPFLNSSRFVDKSEIGEKALKEEFRYI
jgi:hypothetical protein